MSSSSAPRRKNDREDWVEVGARARDVRESLRLTQPEFVERLRRECNILTSVGELSRMETGASELPRAWMPCWAKLDPKKRGPVWLAWPTYGADGEEPPPNPEAGVP